MRDEDIDGLRTAGAATATSESPEDVHPSAGTGGAAKSSGKRSNRHTKRSGELAEGSDYYPHIVARLNANTRVIECAQGIQWIVQRLCNSALRPWHSQYFCRTKAGLLLYAKPITPELLALPDYFARRIDSEWRDWPPDGDALMTALNGDSRNWLQVGDKTWHLKDNPKHQARAGRKARRTSELFWTGRRRKRQPKRSRLLLASS